MLAPRHGRADCRCGMSPCLVQRNVERRTVATGTCGREVGTSCIREHGASAFRCSGPTRTGGPAWPTSATTSSHREPVIECLAAFVREQSNEQHRSREGPAGRTRHLSGDIQAAAAVLRSRPESRQHHEFRNISLRGASLARVHLRNAHYERMALPNADFRRGQLLATSLYDDPTAELHDDASARLGEHLPLPSCSILRRFSPGVRRERLSGSRWRPRGGRRGQSQRATGFSGHYAADQLPNADSARSIGACCRWPDRAQIVRYRVPSMRDLTQPVDGGVWSSGLMRAWRPDSGPDHPPGPTGRGNAFRGSRYRIDQPVMSMAGVCLLADVLEGSTSVAAGGTQGRQR